MIIFSGSYEPPESDVDGPEACLNWAKALGSYNVSYFYYESFTELCWVYSSFNFSCSKLGGDQKMPPANGCSAYQGPCRDDTITTTTYMTTTTTMPIKVGTTTDVTTTTTMPNAPTSFGLFGLAGLVGLAGIPLVFWLRKIRSYAKNEDLTILLSFYHLVGEAT